VLTYLVSGVGKDYRAYNRWSRVLLIDPANSHNFLSQIPVLGCVIGEFGFLVLDNTPYSLIATPSAERLLLQIPHPTFMCLHLQTLSVSLTSPTSPYPAIKSPCNGQVVQADLLARRLYEPSAPCCPSVNRTPPYHAPIPLGVARPRLLHDRVELQ
jgi:hypothetical protein